MTDDLETGELGEALTRVPTGVPGLDRVLDGGLLRGGSYLLEGPSGSGKTVLANQIVFHHAAAGGKVVYFSLLSESHSRLLQNLQGMAFFDPSLIGSAVQYLGGYRALEQGTKPLLDTIRQSLRAHAATFLVLDGLLALEERTDSRNLRNFLHGLQVHTELSGCTALLVSPTELGEFRPEHASVDGILSLCTTTAGFRDSRELHVRKLRGSTHLEGIHSFVVTRHGVRVFPRLESLVGNAVPPPENHRRVSTGVPALDGMIGGGVMDGTTTLVIGAAGTGKTTLGLHFLAAGATLGEPALHFGFFESPQRLIGKAESLGLRLREPSESGRLRILWQPPVEKLLDQLAEEILTNVRELGVKRLFLDGLTGFRQAAELPGRISGFFSALTQELRLLGVTTLLTVESSTLFATEINEPLEGVSSLVENMVLLRYVEVRSSVRRMIGVLKLRESDYDPSLRELRITAQGIQLGGAFEGTESLLSGIARAGRI
jgi:circadian clock protein KaiC